MLIAGSSSNKTARHYGKQAAARRVLKGPARLAIGDKHCLMG
jgi:hypothetical protein